MRDDLRPGALSASLSALLYTTTALGGAALLGACNPGVFDDLRDDANILVAEAPDGYARAGFGSVLASFGGPLVGVRVSRLAASAGADSGVRVYAAWTGSALRVDPAAYDVCKDPGDCEAGAGESLAGLTSWRGEALCVATGAPAAGKVLVRCEDSPTMAIERISGPSGGQFGASLAGLPSGDLLVGAPFAGTSGLGAVFVAGSSGSLVEVDLLAARTGGVTRLGANLAVAPTGAGGALAAITASGSMHRRVIVTELDAAGASTWFTCLDDPGEAFGAVVAVGRLVGADDVPDVVVADDPTQPSHRDEVRIYDGAALRAAPGECPTSVTPTVVACASARGVVCAGSGFGTALAIGDVDGDGDGDLAVGAPNATFEGVADAGGVWLIPGNGTTLEATGADVLTDGEPSSSARLGTSLAMVESRDGRFEVAAGAPGASAVFLFACSGLAGDGVTAGPRCIPAAM